MDRSRCHACPTRRLCLAAGLEDDALTALSDCVHAGAPMKRGEALFRAGHADTGCYVVRSGVYKTTLLSGDGREHVTGFHFPGELMGLSARADGLHRTTAVALETSTACRVPLDEIPTLWRIGSGPALLELMGASERASQAGQANLSRPAADARVAGFLVGLGRRMKRQGRSDQRLPLPMSRTDLASHLGMTLECLSRVLGRLTDAGVVTAARTEITIHRPERLEELAGHPDP